MLESFACGPGHRDLECGRLDDEVRYSCRSRLWEGRGDNVCSIKIDDQGMLVADAVRASDILRTRTRQVNPDDAEAILAMKLKDTVQMLGSFKNSIALTMN